MSENENYWGRLRQRSVSRRRFIAGSGIAAAGSAAILAGCGDDDDGGSTPGAGATTAAAGATTAAAGATTAAAAGKRGGKITVTKVVPDTGLDPAITVTNPLHPAKAFNHMLVYQLSSNQFYLDAGTAFEQVDATTMRFTLRDGMKFNPDAAGGRAVTAEDVAFSYGRFPTTLKQFASEVNAIQWGWMDKFETPDAKTLVIKLKAPYASAIATMGSSAYAIVNKELTEAAAGNLKDVLNPGAGPYMLKRRDSQGTRYERNPNYYKFASPTGTFVNDGPYVDTWEEIITQDPAAIESRFLAGETDFLAATVDKLKADELVKTKGVVIARANGNENLPITLDAEKWMPHPKLREAFSLAIDREKYIKTILLGDGVYGSQVGPGFDSVLSQEELKGLYKFDPAKAKALWAEGKGNDFFPGGLTSIPATFAPANQTQHDFIRKELESNLGIKVTLKPADLAGFVALATARQKTWDYFIASEGSITTIPDYNALTFWAPSGYGSIFGNMRLDSPIPETKAFAEKAQEWFVKQASELDLAKRKVILQDAQKYFATNFGGAIPLPVAKFFYGAYRDRIKNYPEKDFNLGNSSNGVYRVHNIYVNA